MVKVGRRSDLSMLSETRIEPGDVVVSIIADTEFAVKRRTLH
jgi:hypothetical protein